MREDKLLELLNRKGTSTAKVPSSINRASAIGQSIFEPKKITQQRSNLLDRFVASPTRQLPPVVTRGSSGNVYGGTTVQADYLLTEAGEILMTEDNDNLIL